jgi:hypothetical protein
MRTTRVIYSDDGTLTDITTEMANFHTGSYTFSGFTAAEDYIYIGNIVPFNHFYLKMGTASVASSTMSIDYWTGDSWQATVEIDDQTEGLKQDGFVTYVPDRDHAWIDGNTNGQGRQITGLTDLTIYDKYWIRISFSNDLTADSIMSWIGQKFSNDNDLGSEYPDLNRSTVLTAFEAGKTTWEEQHVRAAEIIVNTLISQKIIYAKGQILERSSFMLPSVSKVAELIFNSFGDDYADQKKDARNEFEKRMNKSIYDVDSNLDGELTEKEMAARQGFMVR